jgi:hypothetical protein
MFKRLQIALSVLALLGLAIGPIPIVAAEPEAPPAEPPVQLLPSDQLDTLLGPIALYPDPLLAQILPAATEPGQVVAAYRYVKAKKDPAKIDAQPWDESVKALARYPDVLKMMDEKLDWTTELGEAFVNQPEDVFNSVQRLRAQAESFGNLKTTPEQVVAKDQNVITIMPADPQIIYVPQYQPQVVYVQQPVNVVAPLITFGAGLALGIWIHNSVNWHSNNVYYYNNGWNNRYPNGGWNNNYHGGNYGNTINRGGNNINIDNSKNINIGNGNGNNGSVWKPQNKPKPNYPGNGNGGKWPNNGNGNRPGGNGNGGKWPNNGNGLGNGNRPGTGNNPNKPATLPGNANRPSGGGLGNGQKPTTLPNKPAERPNAGNLQKPANRPYQPQARPTPQPAGNRQQQFNRDASKSNQAAGNRGGGQANRQAAANRAAQANRGGGGGGRPQRNN